MTSARTAGRIVGILLLLQFACGLTVPFILMKPLTVGVPEFLEAVAASESRIRAAVLLAFVGGALTVSIAIASWPVFRRYSLQVALWFLVVCAGSLLMDAIHNATVLPMLSLSLRYREAGAPDAALYEALAAAVASARRWMHYTQLLFIGGWITLFYGALLRFRLVPPVVAGLGLLGIALQMTGVTFSAFLGYPPVFQLAMVMAPIQIFAAVWLVAKGFREAPLPILAAVREP